MVHDVSNVRLVDAHPERDGGDDQLDLPVAPLSVPLGSQVLPQLSVIVRDLVAHLRDLLLELVAQRLAVLPGQAVHDAGLLPARADVRGDLLQEAGLRALLLHFVSKVRAIEGRLVDVRIDHAHHSNRVTQHLLIRRRR
eukprot:scaffold7359_cov255-Pinguiococcus_pyrenoidosus.AAC.3